MKLWILGCLAGTLLAQSPAFAVVADKFRCSIQLFEQGNVPGPMSESELAIVRVPMAASPDWVPGVSGTESLTGGKFETSDVTVWYTLHYTLYYSASKARAAQDTCLSGFTVRPDDDGDGGVLYGCPYSGPGPEDLPFDPTDYYGPTSFSSTGTPLFRSQDLRPLYIPIKNIEPWSYASVQCQYLGTVE